MICMVCGMQINDTNYSLNSEAFLERNLPGVIKYCPFCGVKHKYLSVENKTYSVEPENLDENILKIIDHAVKLEIFNADFYKKAALIAKNKEVKHMFNAISKIEYMHSRIHQKLGGFTETPVLVNMSYDKYSNDEQLLEMACNREKHAVNYYKKYSAQLKDPVLINIFRALSDVEKEHIELTDK